ncbi:MAG TPA: carbohydrate ABC transporter permease [Aggregatilineales bacterium]|jgi:multiple sugar transport system permease protein|nr:carbohydrate ABC transporter permease [Aggregatilineales bacterium]
MAVPHASERSHNNLVSAARTRARRRLSTFLNYGCLTLLAAFFLFPLIFMLVSSFKPEKAIFDDLKTVTMAFIPRDANILNYQAVFDRVPFGRYMFNSVFVTVATVGLGLLFNSMIAYALARLRWKARSLVLSFVVALMIIPLEAIAVPLLVIVNDLPWIDGTTGWLDTYRVQIIPFAVEAFSIFLFYQFFAGIPRDFDEAALVDGASPFTIYRTIIFPLSRPVFATVAILQMLTMWSLYLWPLIATRGEMVRPLSIGITAFYVQNIRWGQVLAFASLVTIPVLIIFLIFQRWFIRSVAASGIKG